MVRPMPGLLQSKPPSSPTGETTMFKLIAALTVLSGYCVFALKAISLAVAV